MKRSITLLILGVLTLSLPGWNGSKAQVPPQFTGSIIYSPVLVWGWPGSWDELMVYVPRVFIHDGTFYMFFSGMNNAGVSSVGLATSPDGYFFSKFSGNPVLIPTSNGFDSYMVGAGTVVEESTGWVMYYNAGDMAGFGPGPYIGRATATDLTGPWTKSPEPVLTVGSPDEWDNGFIEPDNVFLLDDGSYMMFYSAGNFPSSWYFQIGMATSPDGLVWTKYDDPSTTDPPYAESDPVLMNGGAGEWDERQVWMASILETAEGFEMYYTGVSADYDHVIGYATSPDGISWTKYPDNPIYTLDDDPYALQNGYNIIQGPSVVVNGLNAFMYYSYGVPDPGIIAIATAPITGIESAVDGQRSAVNVFPNPTRGSSQFAVRSSQAGHMTIKIYDAQGRELAVVIDEVISAGEHTVRFDASWLHSGIYFYELSTKGIGQRAIGKLLKN